ncbi:hypothetical protein Ancab_002422 [Ancistrocladus abbreviatus]
MLKPITQSRGVIVGILCIIWFSVDGISCHRDCELLLVMKWCFKSPYNLPIWDSFLVGVLSVMVIAHQGCSGGDFCGLLWCGLFRIWVVFGSNHYGLRLF